jgi:SAM-dependent methyltransferase
MKMQYISNNQGLTEPNFLSKYYFFFIYNQIYKLIKNSNKNTILDFGCGKGYLKKLIKEKNLKVINYDVVNELTEIKNWKNCHFDLVVFSQVLMYLEKSEVQHIFKHLRKVNSDLIVVFSNQNFLNKLGSYLFGHFKAHTGTKLKPSEEEKILVENFKVKICKNFLLFKIYYLTN